MIFGATIALGCSLVLVMLGARQGDGRAVLAVGAFTVMGTLLAAHGIATPSSSPGPACASSRGCCTTWASSRCRTTHPWHAGAAQRRGDGRPPPPPDVGDDLLAGLGFAVRVRRMVAGRHERLDGGACPAGLRAAPLDLETRILTVCDVYDALVSPRVHRGASEPERALSPLREETGSACVAALELVVARKPVAILA